MIYIYTYISRLGVRVNCRRFLFKRVVELFQSVVALLRLTDKTWVLVLVTDHLVFYTNNVQFPPKKTPSNWSSAQLISGGGGGFEGMQGGLVWIRIPQAQCMVYLPTFTP